MQDRLIKSNPTPDDYTYLTKFNYISNNSIEEIKRFLMQNTIIPVASTALRCNLNLIMIACGLPPISSAVSTTFLLSYLDRCTLSDEEKKMHLDSLEYNVEGKVDLRAIVDGEQYLRMIAERKGRF